MKVVIDASAGMRIATGDWHSALLFDSHVDIIAPDLFVNEIANACWKHYAIDQLPLRKCKDIMLLAISLVRIFVPSRELCQEALLLSASLRRPAYDMFYLALAIRESACLLTADRRLKAAAELAGVTLAN